MSFPPRPRLTATLFRLTLTYAGVFVAATLVLLIGGGEAAYRLRRAALEAQVERRVDDLLTTYRRDGMEGLAGHVRAQERRADPPGLTYRLETPQGERLAGRLDGVAGPLGWSSFTPIGEDSDEVHSAHATRLSNGGRLVVSYDPEPLYDVRELMQAGSFWALAISLPLALICGGIVSARVLRRIRLISDTAGQVRSGSLSARVPVSDAGDEFDRLAVNVNQMLDSVEALTRNLENVTVGIAHDLRTPLSRVRNRLEALRNGATDPSLREAKIEGALQDIADLLVTFDALLRIGQIDAGAQRSGFRAIDLSGLFEELVETYAVVAAAEDRTLTATISPGLATVGDRALLAQMLANALDNSIQHTPTGARIEVVLRSDGAARILGSISDDGPGIPADQHEEVLRRFRSLDRNGGRNHGLGLSIVQAIAKLHGVEMTLEDNAPGLRVVFRFRPTG
jgi:signal transduction histidine kinase